MGVDALSALGPIQGRAATGAGVGSSVSDLAAGTPVSGQIMGRAGAETVVRIRGQDFLFQLPQRWPSNVDQLSLVYLGGGKDEAKFLLLQPGATQNSATASLSVLGRVLFGSGPAVGPTALSLSGVYANSQPAASTLAAKLQGAVEDSGIFYEGHLQAWAQGNYPLQRLLQEPQGRLSPILGQKTDQPPNPAAATSPSALASVPALQVYAQVAAQSAGAPSIPAPLQALLQQQGQVLQQQQLTWTFSPWPGQSVFWTIGKRRGEDEQEEAARDEQGVATWDSRVQLDLPALGHLDARLRLQGDRLALRLRFDPETLGIAQEHLAALHEALRAYGLDTQIVAESDE
ncbi:flagellar hook-length control protein FliK [Candidatus Igneacidithiobacillus taiwanensis]|uniref:flagellar hook-length control protein FliK n=1 Tax=Candidatus Igneacidithiobacillus taiwanensis TaxID=1945924 RepID=UPI0028A0FD08|nr:flagellar hook-length control protein FliK [Candidatus Igneacidithiobacillus taiwanensis]